MAASFIGHQFDRTFEVFYGLDFADKVIFLVLREIESELTNSLLVC